MTGNGDLLYIYTGAFSGSARSLQKALATKVHVIDYDLMPLSRRPSLLFARLRALNEARKVDRRVPWTKTAVWSAAAQCALLKARQLKTQRPTLFVQTLPAFVLDPTIRYGIYTDRVAREGAAVHGPYASRFTAGWLEREETFLRRAHRVYVMGPSTKDVLTTEYGLSAAKVRIVGAGPNAALGPPAQTQSCRKLLFVGTDWGLKGGPDLLDAFANVRPDFSDLELLLVGSRPEGRLPRGVSAVGRVPQAQMDALYSRVDAVVIPTRMEAFGIALAEGLMKGLPCIGTTIGNQSWIIGDAGECIEPGRADLLEAAMRRLIAEYPRYRKLALARGQVLRESLRWESVASTILEDLL